MNLTLKVITLLILLLVSFSGFAQDSIVVAQSLPLEAPEIPDGTTRLAFFLSSLGTFAIGAIIYFFSEAFKHVFTKDFSIEKFIKSNIESFAWSVGGAVVIMAIMVFLPIFLPFLEKHIGVSLDLEAKTLIIAGGIIGAFVKGIIKTIQNRKKIKIEA